MIKQALILAAGKSSRFQPFSAGTQQTSHKAEIKIMGRPIIYWTLDAVRRAGLEDVVVVINPQNKNLEKLLRAYPGEAAKAARSGEPAATNKDPDKPTPTSQFQNFKIAYQKKALGQGDAVLTARDHLQDRFVVLNCHYLDADFYLEKMNQLDEEIILPAIPTDNPGLYGIVEVDQQNYAKSLIEKPTDYQVPALRSLVIRALSNKFVDFMSQEKPEEYLLETALNKYLQQHKAKVLTFDRKTPSYKYPWHLLDFKNQVFNYLNFQISSKAQIANTAIIKGKVFIDDGAIINDYAVIEGPAYIGPKAVVGQYCVVRKGSVLEAGAEIQRHGDVANSILMAGAHAHSGFIGDSIIGENARVGAGLVTANRRFDRGEIKTLIKNKKINSKRSALGLIAGHQVQIGIQVGTMPGVIVANKASIEPGTIVKKNVG